MNWLWFLPIIGAAIGYCTNWLAVQMLLRPRSPVRILGITWVGVIPKRKKELASAVAQVVSSRLLTREDVARMVTRGKMGAALKKALDVEIDAFIESVMQSLPALVRGVVSGVLIQTLRVEVQTRVHAKMPELAGNAAEMLEGSDVKDIVESRINGLDQTEVEKIVLKVARRELRTVEVLGGVLGGLIGFVQLGVVLIVG